MRAWWRHWNIGTEDAAAAANTTSQQEQPQNASPPAQHQQRQQQQQATNNTAATASPFGQQAQQSQQPEQQLPVDDEELPRPLVQQLQHQPSLLHGQARQEEITSMMAAGWEAVVLRDWAASLQHLTHVWTSTAQDFDGVLGFSNGAAAAFLFAAHAAAHPETFGSLRFVALAGGYVPEPLHKLLHPSLLAAAASTAATGAADSGSEVAPVNRLKAPLPFPSLHMMGSNDPLIDVEVATQLMQCFQEHGRCACAWFRHKPATVADILLCSQRIGD
jgi:dienelactone hydrolase